MPYQIQLRRGTTAQNIAFTGAIGELTVDTQLNTLRVQDGSTAGGWALVNVASVQTLTNKTLTAPIISTISNSGTLTLPSATDTLVGRATTDTLTNKTLTAPIISTISNSGTLTLPTSTDTLVGRATTDTLTNKTLTAPTITSGLTIDSFTISGLATFNGNISAAGGSNTIGIAGIVTISNATASTTTANGALKVTGGAGIGGNLNVGGTLVVAGINIKSFSIAMASALA
jgi:hypothetical protein